MRIMFSMWIGAGLVVLPQALYLDPLAGGLAVLAFAIASACLVSARVSALSVTVGALGGLAYATFVGVSVGLAAGLLLAAIALARAPRSPHVGGAAALVALAFVGGGLAGWGLAVALPGASLPLVALASLGGGVLGGAFLWVPVDDRLSAGLRARAGALSPKTRGPILRAVAFRRRFVRIAPTLGRGARRPVSRAFRALATTLDQLEASPIARRTAEPRIRAYVDALGRATRAAERSAALDGRGDALVLAELQRSGEELQVVTEAREEAEAVA